MKTSVDILIPSTGNYKNLHRLLKSIFLQNRIDVELTVFVLLNGVAKAEFERAEVELGEFNAKLILCSQKGVNFARNLGLQIATGEILIFLDDDCELLNEYYLRTHIEYHSENEKAFAYGGVYEIPKEARFFDRVYNDVQTFWLVDGIFDFDSSESMYLLGGNFSIKKSILAGADLCFDSNIVYGGSESEFFFRAKIKELKIYSGGPSVVHHTSEHFKSILRKSFLQGRGQGYLEAKHATELPAMKRNLGVRSIVKKRNCFVFLLGYVFWFGVYSFRKKELLIVMHVLRDFRSHFQVLRFKIFDWLKKKISERQSGGRRF